MMSVMSFEPGHVFVCERRGCERKASRILASYTDEENDLRTVFLCPKHLEEFRKLRNEMFASNERELMAGNILSMLKELNRLVENGDKLKRTLDKRGRKDSQKKPEDELLGGR